MLKSLMQKILVGPWVKNFTFKILSLLKLNFSTTVFDATYLRTTVFKADTGNNRKTANFTYGYLYAGLSKWKLLSNYEATFNLENVNLLSNPNVNPKNRVAYEKNM